MNGITRRGFLATAAAALPALDGNAQQAGARGPQVCIFSKHLQFLNYQGLAKTAKDLGLDGVDLTVREGGHVAPANVAADLPRAVETLRAEGIEVPMISTRLYKGDDPDARPILGAASKLGIRFFRIGGQQYDKTGDPMKQLPRFAEELGSLTKLAEEFDMIAGYHNHSGYNNVGAALWDLRELFDAIGSQHLGSNYDVGHAAVEGAYGVWQIDARMMAPYVKMMAVKDFVWNKDEPAWVPLGQGVVKTVECFEIVCAAGFAGPISIHFEYKTASRDALLDDMRAAVKTLRENLKAAGYA